MSSPSISCVALRPYQVKEDCGYHVYAIHPHISLPSAKSKNRCVYEWRKKKRWWWYCAAASFLPPHHCSDNLKDTCTQTLFYTSLTQTLLPCWVSRVNSGFGAEFIGLFISFSSSYFYANLISSDSSWHNQFVWSRSCYLAYCNTIPFRLFGVHYSFFFEPFLFKFIIPLLYLSLIISSIQAGTAGELSFPAGAQMYVGQRLDPHWWAGT